MAKCDKCIRKYKCHDLYKYRHAWSCTKHKEFKIRKAKPFNSKKYTRNPRERGYMLIKRRADGTIYALADTSVMTVGWESSCGILWRDYVSIEFYLHETKKWKDYDIHDEIFVVRVNTKRCPVEVDFKREAPGRSKGNVLFKLKDNTDKYYKEVIH